MEFQCTNLHFVNSDFSKNLIVLSASTSYNIVVLNDLMKHASKNIAEYTVVNLFYTE